MTFFITAYYTSAGVSDTTPLTLAPPRRPGDGVRRDADRLPTVHWRPDARHARDALARARPRITTPHDDLNGLAKVETAQTVRGSSVS